MKIFHDLERVEGLKAPVFATIGNFDGVHCGHQAILKILAEKASKAGGTSVAVTFHPHPMQVLALDKLQKMLTTTEQKIALLKDNGVGATVMISFTPEFARKSPQEFVEDLCKAMPVKEIYVGRDFRFGHFNAGDVETLAAEGRRHDVEVHTVPFLSYHGQKLGSSAIRSLLGEGKVEEVAELLGRYYFIEGDVVRGDGRGKKIGIPTANIDPFNEIIPLVGVYATWFYADGIRHPSVTNIGFRPTFHKHSNMSVEAHALSFPPAPPLHEDFLGKVVRLEFVRRLREEKKFAGPDALKAQIEEDISSALLALRK
jgi:riboflavin kinase/FMN adenylyltransferase